eukprot:Rmarinus@m.23667
MIQKFLFRLCRPPCVISRSLSDDSRRNNFEMVLQGLSVQYRTVLESLRLCRSDPGFVAVRGGPGTGKTEVIPRIAALLIANGACGSNIAVLANTSEAAMELHEKTSNLLKPVGVSDLPRCGSLNALAADIIYQKGPQLRLINYTARKHFLSRILSEEFGFGLPQESFRTLATTTVSVVKSFANPAVGLKEATARLRTKFLREKKEHFRLSSDNDPSQYLRKMSAEKIISLLHRRYVRALEAEGCMDSDDQILAAIRLLEDNPVLLNTYRERFPYILVDDAQNMTDAQAALALRLASKNFIITSDSDQMICGLRGAKIPLYARMKQHGAREIVLSVGHRMPPPIVDAVRTLLPHRTWHLPSYEKEFSSRKRRIICAQPPGRAAELDFAVDCVQYYRSRISPRIALSKIAIMVRTWDEYCPALVEALASAENPIAVSPRVMLEEVMPVEAFVAMLRPDSGEHDSGFLLDAHIRDIQSLTRRCGIGSCTVPNIEKAILSARDKTLSPAELVRAARQTGYWNVLRRCYSHPKKMLELSYSRSCGDTGAEESFGMLQNDPIKKCSARARGIHILTPQAAKGREYDAVIVLGIGRSFLSDHDPLEEEKRLLYVAMTRAKSRLSLSFPLQSARLKSRHGTIKMAENFIALTSDGRSLRFPSNVLVRAVRIRKTSDSPF